MSGATRIRQKHGFGRNFAASQYDSPFGGQSTALDRNIMRYRAIEVTLYLFYAEEIRNLILANMAPMFSNISRHGKSKNAPDDRSDSAESKYLSETEMEKKCLLGKTTAPTSTAEQGRQYGRKFNSSMKHALNVGLINAEEADELRLLLDYRNDIAHRIHTIFSDINPSYTAIDFNYFNDISYKGYALDRIRKYRELILERAQKKFVVPISISPVLFDFAKRTYEDELKKLERAIRKQIEKEQIKYREIGAELDLQGTELTGDLHPRHPANRRFGRIRGDDYTPSNGHLTERGVEICYRLFDIGKSPLTVAYLMGITLRTAKRRRKGWLKAGGMGRTKAEVLRYHPKSEAPIAQEGMGKHHLVAPAMGAL